MAKRPIILTADIAARLGPAREWGLPSLLMPGRVWHSKRDATISCVLATKPELVIDTRPLQIVDDGEEARIPRTWHRAMAAYAVAWPYSGLLQACASTAISPRARMKAIAQIAGLVAGMAQRIEDGAHIDSITSTAASLGDLLDAWAGPA